MNDLVITVPASSANIGPGFDSVGIAVERYLTLNVAKSDHWHFEHRSACLPKDNHFEHHYIYQIACQVAAQFNKTLTPCHVVVHSDIPLARGLGSSSSAVIAGIELANQICALELSTSDKLKLATDIEGHPDNVAPALLGGLIVTTTANEVEYVRLAKLGVDIVLFIPTVELKTEDARQVLPTTLSRTEATNASSVCNVMIAALLTEDYALVGRMMEADRFHEPHRAKLIPNYDHIKQNAKALGAYGTVISGAGPTLMSFAPKGKGQDIVKHMQIQLPNYEITTLKVDETGLQTRKQ